MRSFGTLNSQILEVGEHVDETRREICKEHLPAIKYFFKAQQQREYEEEMKGKYRRSQSIEMAAEAAVLVSSRSLHPRDFFRQQERSVSCSFSPPSTPSSPSRFAPGVPHKPAFRYQRSLTESVLSPSPQNPSYVSSTYRRDSDRSPSPAPPKPLSPAFIFSKSALPVSSPKVESLPSFIPPPIVPPRAGSLQYRNISSSTTSPRSYSKETVTLEESQAMQSLPTGIPLQASPLQLYTPLKPEFEPSKASNVNLLNDTYKAELVPIAAQPTEDLVSIHTTKSHVWAEKVDVIPTDNVTKKHISSHICPSPVNVHYITTPETPLNVNQTSGHPDNSKEATHVTASPTSRSNLYTLPPNTDSGSPSPNHETSDPRLYSENTQPPAPPTTKDTSPASPATIETMLPLFSATRVDIRSPSPPATEDMPSAPPPAVKPTLSASPLTVVDTPAGTLPSRDATTHPLPPIRKVLPPQFSSSVEAVPPVAVGTEATIPQFQPSKEEQPTYTSPSTPLPSLLSFVSPSPYIPFRSDSIRHATSRFDRSAAFPSINESPQLNARVSPASDVHQDSKDWYDLQTSKSQDVREKLPTSASLEPFNDVGHELPNISPPNVTRAPPSSDPSSTATETLTTLSTDIMTASPTPGSQTLSMETLTTVSTDIRTTSPTTSSQSLCMDTLATPSTDIMTTSPTSTSQTVCMDTLTTAPNDTLSTSPTLSSQTLSVDTSPITISQTLAMDTLRHAPTDIFSTSPTPSPQTSMCTLTTSSTDILTTSPSPRSKSLSVDTLPIPSTSTITTLPTTSSQTLSVDTLSTAPNDIMITSPTTFAPSIDIVTAPSSESTSTSAAPATERPGLEKEPTPVNETPCTSTSNTLDHSEYTTNDHALLSEAPLAGISFLSNLSATPGSFTCESSSDVILSAEEPKITSSQVSQAPPPTENIIPFQAPPTDNSFACKTPETPPTRSSLTCEFPPIENLLPIEISLSTREAPFTDNVPPTETPIICTSLTCETPPTVGCFDAPPPEKSIPHEGSLIDKLLSFDAPPPEKSIPHEGSLIDKLLSFDAPPPDNSRLWEEPPIYNIITTETPPTDRYEAPPTTNASPDEAAESSCTAPSADTLSLAEAPPITCSVQYHAPPIDTILPLQDTPTDNMLLFDTAPSGTTITSEAPPTAEILSFESPITNRSIVFEAPPTDHITLLASPYNDILSSDPPTDDLLMLDSTPFGNTQNHRIGGFKETLSPQTLEPRPEAEIFQIVHTVEMRSETLSDITAHTTGKATGPFHEHKETG
uniref:Uncharacterized protein n=1 Tax=Leptobrachium leishanense TaxID=445787 RepID=A0A8C5N066_9ANUR